MVDKAQIIQDLHSKLSVATELLAQDAMKLSSDTLFDRLLVALERRRATVIQEMEAWQQRRDQLQSAVRLARELDDAESSKRKLCDVEAELDAAISHAIGVFPISTVDGEAADALSALINSLGVSRTQEQETLSRIAIVPQVSEVTTEASTPLPSVHTVFKVQGNSVSITRLGNEFYVLEVVPTRKIINVYNTTGSRLRSFALNSPQGQAVSCNPFRLRSCDLRQMILVVDQKNNSIFCARYNGKILCSISIPAPGCVNDVTSTGQHIVVCCLNPTGIFTAVPNTLTSSDVRKCDCDVALANPVQLAWCSESKSLIVVDRVENNTYSILGFSVSQDKLIQKAAPNFSLKSVSCPGLLVSKHDVFISWKSGHDSFVSWFPTCATSNKEEVCRIWANDQVPTDACWWPTASTAMSNYDRAVVCYHYGSIVSFQRVIQQA